MRHDAKELADAEDGESPSCGALGEPDEMPRGRFVLGQLEAMGVNENVRIDGDHERPSIFS
jgi:hypothetical protein